MKRLATLAAAICILFAALFAILQANPSTPGVWATWQDKTIQVRGDGVALNAGNEYADVEAQGHRIRIAKSTITVNGKSNPVPPFKRVVIEVTPGGVSVLVDGKPLPSA